MFYIDPNSLMIEEIGRRVWPANKADSFNVEEKGWEIQIKNNLDEAFHRHWFKRALRFFEKEVIEVRRGLQAAIGPIGPHVIRATERGLAARIGVHQLGAAVHADVVKRPDNFIFAADDQN